MSPLIELAASGLVTGLASGLAPGPLFAVVVMESLSGSWRRGAAAALSPLFSDSPIVAASLILTGLIGGLGWPLALLALVGAGYVGHLGWVTMRSTPQLMAATKLGLETGAPRLERAALRRGVLVNLLSPHPYLFWFTVGGPLMIGAMREKGTGWVGPAVFLAAFYLCLVGSKLGLAWLTGRWGSKLGGRGYMLVMRVLGLGLMILAALLVADAASLLRGAT